MEAKEKYEGTYKVQYFESSKDVLGFSWAHKMFIKIFGAMKCKTCKRIPTEITHSGYCLACLPKD